MVILEHPDTEYCYILTAIGMQLVDSWLQDMLPGIPGWRSGLAPAFGPGRDPGDPGSNPTSGSQCMEPASPSAFVSASLSPGAVEW